jgi:CheY-like chemotaxis protein
MCAVLVPSPIPAEPATILIVEGDADTRALYREIFESRNYSVVEACDGREALIKAFIRTPALVVMEFTLPHVDGCSLIEILRRDRATCTVPVLMITAETAAICLQRARKAGADVTLQKPVAIDRIVSESERLLGTRRDDASEVVIAEGDGPDAAEGAPRRSLSKSFPRCTTTAPLRAPLPLTCPSCDRSLTYQRSHIGGVNAQAAEQWDDYSCTSCGTFQYRQRTRKLKPTT